MKPPVAGVDPSAEIDHLVREIEASGSPEERRRKIVQLGALGDSGGTRHLISLYAHTMWRETRIDIIRALSGTAVDRGLEFLIGLIRDQADLQIGAEAVLALSRTTNPLAGEVLLGLIADHRHPLAKEAVIGLANMDLFLCDTEFLRLLDRHTELGQTMLQFLIIGMGRKGRGGSSQAIERFLDPAGFPPPIFNAALLAAGHLGGRETLRRLEALDTRYRFFAEQLRVAAIAQIHFRLSATIEDLYAMLLASPAPVRMAGMIRQYPHDDAWESFTILGDQADAAVQAIVRLALPDQRRVDEDLRFVRDHPDLPGPLKAELVRGCFQQAPDVTLATVTAAADPVELCHMVAHPLLVDWLLDTRTAAGRTVAGINALVAQAMMRPEVTDRIGETLAKRLGTMDAPLRQRAIRALGQLRYDRPITYTALQAQIRTEDFASCVSALGALRSDEAQGMLVKQLKQLPAEGWDQNRLAILIAKLSGLEVRRPEVIARFLDIGALRDDLLKILGQGPVEGGETLVDAALTSTHHQTVMLAIAAARHHHSPAIIDRLWEHYRSDSQPLRFRALDTLCRIPDGPLHLRLIESLADQPRDLTDKLVRSLTPVPGFKYGRGVDSLRRLMTASATAMDTELINSVQNLIDNLLLHSGADLAAADTATHRVDQRLGQLIPGFKGLPHSALAALRNAELTMEHEDLFNELVDKSTVVISYVKCIDLLFQERIGTRMFLGSTKLLDEMRSRFLRLGLDEDSMANEALVELLQCGQQFTAADFPGHKVFTLCQAFLSGKIAREQYRIIDGLRAWGLMLLLFGRSYTHKGQTLPSLLPVKDPSNRTISRLCHDLNQLQELRNLAAHVGTLVAKDQVQQLRSASMDCLNRTLAVLA